MTHSQATAELQKHKLEKPVLPISASGTISRKRHATGFEPRRHKC